MKPRIPLLLPAALLGLAVFASAQETSSLSLQIPQTYPKSHDIFSDSVKVATDDAFSPEFDVSYAFTSHLSAELMLSASREHSAKINSAQDGTFREPPPSFFIKYSFSPIGRLTPYFGAGINNTASFDTISFDTPIGAGRLSLDNVGPAALVGCNYRITENWSIITEVKKIDLSADVIAGGTKITEVRLDPWLYSIKVCCQF